MFVLVLEASTTSAKAMVYSDSGQIVRLEVEPFEKDINAVTDQFIADPHQAVYFKKQYSQYLNAYQATIPAE